MINAYKSRQTWAIGQTVNVGFMTGLIVFAIVPTPGDYDPDAYLLVRGANFYQFVPHKGIQRATADEVRTLVEQSRAIEQERLAEAMAIVERHVEAARIVAQARSLTA